MRLASNRIDVAANFAIVIVAAVLLVLLLRPFVAKDKKEPASNKQPSIAAGTTLSIPNVGWSSRRQTLVFALSTHCHFCTESTEFYHRVLATVADRPGIALLALFPETVTEAQKYLDEHELRIPEIRQISLPSLGINGTPTLLLVDQAGSVINSWQGKLRPEKEAEMLDQIGSNSAKSAKVEPIPPVIDSAYLRGAMASGEQPMVIDVRERSSFKDGHIPGAKCIPTDELGIRAEDELRTSQLIVLYGNCTECNNDGQTPEIEKSLLELGYPRVTRLKGGIEGWRQAGYDTAKDSR